MALVGNKSDRYESLQVSEEEAKGFAKEINAIYQLVSAKDGTGINELFHDIGKKYLNLDLSQEAKKIENEYKEDVEKENQIKRENENDKNCILL